MLKLTTYIKIEIETSTDTIETFNIGRKLLSQADYKKLSAFRKVKTEEWQSKLSEIQEISKIISDEKSTPEEIIEASTKIKEYEKFNNQDVILDEIAKQEFKVKLTGDTTDLEAIVETLHNGYQIIMTEIESQYNNEMSKK